jgi:hypothetical protein
MVSLASIEEMSAPVFPEAVLLESGREGCWFGLGGVARFWLGRRHVARGGVGRIGTLRGMGLAGRRGERQDLADRLDPACATMIIDKGDRGLNRLSSSACERQADALRRISLAGRASRTSRYKTVIRPAPRSSRAADGLRPVQLGAPLRRTAGREGNLAELSLTGD